MRRTYIRIILTALLLTVFISAPILADEIDHHDLSVEDAIGQIRDELGLSAEEPIDPDRVPPEMLELLGDAVMAEMAVTEAQHEWMDTMMGGEGSESLASTHRWMGYRYLTGGYGGGFGPGGGPSPDGAWGPGRRGGMHGGMMGPGMMGRWGMMGNPDWGTSPDAYDSPEEIARRRYAQGEITRDEFREIMDELER